MTFVKSYIFADYALVYTRLDNNQGVENFQRVLWQLEQPSTKWDVSFNIDKCQIVCFNERALDNRKLAVADNSKYLGVNIQNNFSWAIHIDRIGAY